MKATVAISSLGIMAFPFLILPSSRLSSGVSFVPYAHLSERGLSGPDSVALALGICFAACPQAELPRGPIAESHPPVSMWHGPAWGLDRERGLSRSAYFPSDEGLGAPKGRGWMVEGPAVELISGPDVK